MEDIICPKCNDIVKADDKWDFIDGEKHKITCSRRHQFEVIVERPIEYYITEAV